MTTLPSYKEEFFDFGELDVTIPAGFVDASWCQDAMPSFVKEQADGTFLRLWIDYADRAKSDLQEEPYFRFYLSHVDQEHTLIYDIAMDNDFSKIVLEVNEWALPSKPSPRPR